MKEIVVAKFDPIYGQEAEDTVIKITDKIPDTSELGGGIQWFENMRKFYDKEAEAIADTLFNSLPQGTFDRLWVAIMRRKMSLYGGKTDG